MIKDVHDRLKQVPWGQRVRVASLCGAEVDAKLFLPLYDIWCESATLNQGIERGFNLDFHRPHVQN
jgi:hypothetical protein